MTPEEQKLVDESFATMNLESEDLVADRVEQIKVLFPEVAVEGDGTIDFEKLRLILGDEVDEGQERYAFTWPGKADAIRQAQTPSTATLRPDKADSVDWDTTENLYIEGDNLEVLKLLQRGYHGKVKMIYIDPPYNTGHDFIYKDSFGDTIANYKEQAGLTGQSNAKTDGHYHSAWNSNMLSRLRLARELLANDGILVASIDENERLNLQAILNEVFGEENFAGEVIWKNSSKNDQAYVSVQHEYLLIYVKDKSTNLGEWTEQKEGLEEIYAAFDGFKQKYGDDWAAIHKAALDWYKQFPPSSPIYGSKHYSWMDERGIYFPADISGPNHGQYVYDVTHPTTGKVVKSPSSGWRYPEEEMKRRISEGLVHFGVDETTVPNNKTYLKETERQSLTSIYYRDGRVASKRLAALFDGMKVFSNPKDPHLLEKFFAAFNLKNGDMVLDFFSGSGTTAEAVMDYSYQNGIDLHWILVQLDESLEDNLEHAQGSNKTILKNAINLLKSMNKELELTKIAEERIRRVGKRIENAIEESNRALRLGEEPSVCPDIGFRILKLDSSNFDEVPDGALYDNIVKSDRSHDDIIFEMMLKWGLDLSLPMEDVEIEGYPVTSIAADELICCMDDGLTVPILEAIAAREPKRVFFLDSVLTDTLKLNAAQIFKRVGDKLGYEIELRTV